MDLNEAEFCAESATPIAVCLTCNRREDADRKVDTAKGGVDPAVDLVPPTGFSFFASNAFL